MKFDELRSLAAGFQPAKLLLVALDLGVFDALAEKPLTAEAVAAELGLEPRATGIVLNALVSLELLERDESGYRSAETSRTYLVRGGADDRGEILRHLHNTWEDWERLEVACRTGGEAQKRRGQQLPTDEEELRHFILGMENVTRDLAPRLAEELPLGGCRRALDLGGGPGNYSLAFVRRWPDLRVTHFDLPETSAIAREFLAGKEEGDRIGFLEGDFLEDTLGGEYDFVWASQIIHMLGEEDGRRLVARIAAALAPGGTLAVHDQFLDAGKTSPRAAALFGVHMLVVTGAGRTYSFEEVEQWLRFSGLEPLGRLDYGGSSRVLLGGKGG